MRSKAKHLPAEEMREFESWLRRSPENASALLSIAARDRHGKSRHRSTNRLKRVLRQVLRQDSRASEASAERGAISKDYFKHLRKKYLLPKIALLATALCGVAGYLFLQDDRLLQVSGIAFGCFSLLWIREVVVGLRIKHGYFGSTESEVRDFVTYISRYRDEIDFTDEGGKRRPALVPEPRLPHSTTSASSAPTGVLPE